MLSLGPPIPRPPPAGSCPRGTPHPPLAQGTQGHTAPPPTRGRGCRDSGRMWEETAAWGQRWRGSVLGDILSQGPERTWWRAPQINLGRQMRTGRGGLQGTTVPPNLPGLSATVQPDQGSSPPLRRLCSLAVPPRAGWGGGGFCFASPQSPGKTFRPHPSCSWHQQLHPRAHAEVWAEPTRIPHPSTPDSERPAGTSHPTCRSGTQSSPGSTAQRGRGPSALTPAPRWPPPHMGWRVLPPALALAARATPSLLSERAELCASRPLLKRSPGPLAQPPPPARRSPPRERADRWPRGGLTDTVSWLRYPDRLPEP